jgi:hypothetical protein
MWILAVVFLIVSWVLAVMRQEFTAGNFALWAIAVALLVEPLRALFH